MAPNNDAPSQPALEPDQSSGSADYPPATTPVPIERGRDPVDHVDLLQPPPLPPGVRRSPNYLAAVELGHVLAASRFYEDAIEPARAAVKVMIGMDLGITPTAALQGIHTMQERGRTVFLIEGKLLGAVIKARPDIEYQFVERSDERVEIAFIRDGVQQEPTIVWDLERAKRAGLTGKDNWVKYPREMLTWRALAEGVRAHLPDVIAGQPIYAAEEFDLTDDDLKLREALEPAKAQPLTDEKAETLRSSCRAKFDELRELNPERLVPGRFASMIAGAEHSHEQLENVEAALGDLVSTETRIVELKAELAGVLDAKALKPILERAERRGSQRERIEVLEQALAESGDQPSDGEASE